jgi:hypothetical protein
VIRSAVSFGHSDLEERRVEAEVLFEREREGRRDRGDEPGRIGHELRGRRLPFLHRALAVPGVVGDELFLGPPELGLELPQLIGRVRQPGIGKEVTESVEKRKRVAFDERMGAAFDQGEAGGGFPGEEPLVAEADQPVGHHIGFEPDVFGPEFLAAAPVAHADVDEHALTGEDVE